MSNVHIDQQTSFFDGEVGKKVMRIPNAQARPYIERIHYSRKMPNNVTDSFALFVNGEIRGVVTYGVPASRCLCIGIAGKENEKHVKELNRLVILPGGVRTMRAFSFLAH